MVSHRRRPALSRAAMAVPVMPMVSFGFCRHGTGISYTQSHEQCRDEESGTHLGCGVEGECVARIYNEIGRNVWRGHQPCSRHHLHTLLGHEAIGGHDNGCVAWLISQLHLCAVNPSLAALVASNTGTGVWLDPDQDGRYNSDSSDGGDSATVVDVEQDCETLRTDLDDFDGSHDPNTFHSSKIPVLQLPRGALLSSNC